MHLFVCLVLSSIPMNPREDPMRLLQRLRNSLRRGGHWAIGDRGQGLTASLSHAFKRGTRIIENYGKTMVNVGK